jgi:hypothetical protein
MRFAHPGGGTVHLAYGTNVHPADDVPGITDQLRRFAEPVRDRLGWPRLGVGLWLSAGAASALAGDDRLLDQLGDQLRRARLEVVTLNGFPYRRFHAPVVKHAVYRPDWADPERLRFTVDLARVLHRLLPDDVEEGSISTLPLGWRAGWSEDRAAAAHDQLLRLGDELAALAARTGRRVRVAVEPEPGCAVERTAQLVTALAGLDPEWIGACLDACHLAVGFEDPVEAVARLDAAGVAVVKAQLSSALRSVGDHRELCGFVEPRFLHQARARDGDGAVTGVDDLDQALSGGLAADGEWRVHFHVPVHIGAPSTTQAELDRTIDALLAPAPRRAVGDGGPVTRHLEVETYTWSVLPAGGPPGIAPPRDDDGLVAGLSAELAWAAGRLTDAGLTMAP